MKTSEAREYRGIFCAGLRTTIAFPSDLWSRIDSIAKQHHMTGPEWVEWKLARFPYSSTRTAFIREQVARAVLNECA